MISKKHFVIVSEKALREGQIGLIYRVPSSSPMDSGWRMMHDREEDRLALGNPDRVYACRVSVFLEYFPEFDKILSSRTYSVWEKKNGSWELLGRDKELSQVPNKMTGKRLYSSVGGAIIQPNPKDMRHGRRTEEWELLLPSRMQKRSR